MNLRPSRQLRRFDREFVASVTSLEGRQLLSAVSHFTAIERLAPERAGTAVQTSPDLTVAVNSPVTNTIHVNNTGAGKIAVEWNGGPFHSFAGVTEILVHAENARNDRITFNLGSDSSSASEIAVCARTPVDTARPVAGDRRFAPIDVIRAGVAVQSGTKLTVTVKRPTSNSVAITDQGSGRIDVQWNGSSLHTFQGVETVVVHTEEARENQVTLGWANS